MLSRPVNECIPRACAILQISMYGVWVLVPHFWYIGTLISEENAIESKWRSVSSEDIMIASYANVAICAACNIILVSSSCVDLKSWTSSTLLAVILKQSSPLVT